MKRDHKNRSIGRQVIARFCWFALAMSAAFSFMSFMILFTVEDEFLERDLRAERDKIVAIYEQSGEWPKSDLDHMVVYESTAALPEDMRAQFIEEPRRREFYGLEGRHYHMIVMADDVFLIAEVSERLLIRPFRSAIVTVFTVLTLLLTVGGCLAAYRLARSSISPLTKLAEFVEGAEPSKLPDDFASAYPRNEVGSLALALQKSLGRIRDFIKREQHFNRDVSHDLRTPIAVVSGAVEVLQKRHALDAETKALVSRIDIANRHMGRTVEALLSLAREEDSNQHRETIKILPVLERTVLQFGHFLDDKDVEVVIKVAAADAVYLQPGVLEILLANLLGNAFEYTDAGAVKVEFQNGLLEISDTGGGIAEELQNTMFDIGNKGEESSGFGLGLSIVKRICEHHKVDIFVDHKPDGTLISLNFQQKN